MDKFKKEAVRGIQSHNQRERESHSNPDIDYERTTANYDLCEHASGNYVEAIQSRIDDLLLVKAVRKDAVHMCGLIVSSDSAFFERLSPEDTRRFFEESRSFLSEFVGAENVISAMVHMDEKTPHMHVTLVPIVKGERKRRKREEQAKKRYRKKPADTVRLCADDIMTRLKLKSYQDSYAVAMAKYGLQRGIEGSKARHKSTTQYYRDTQRLADSLKAEVVDLQQQKETAQEELKQAKKEVQTEKLKGAATTAATNIAESVGSLFGGGKMKALERRNEDLQDRIFELEEEAQQREYQQVKQIQEIKNAYEQQNSKLSEFVDFVKRYFPYVEKLMPTIKFLRDTLNFGDAVIRKLCTFKDVSIKGELYSREFNQHFRVDKTICSLKEDKDGNFSLNIDGVSHVSWFRRKKDEFMETLGLSIKNKYGMKL